MVRLPRSNGEPGVITQRGAGNWQPGLGAYTCVSREESNLDVQSTEVATACSRSPPWCGDASSNPLHGLNGACQRGGRCEYQRSDSQPVPEWVASQLQQLRVEGRCLPQRQSLAADPGHLLLCRG